ncbi:MAG: hypothetical protein B7Z63_04435 [Ignavibacteriae bacterium 37-53-5]|nr:MAG: hypothetical protein B7Z63_04435 [Ignavibacteriae bacterium 37-53-5]
MLDGLPPAPRGIPQIEVTFDIDANGLLHVAAKDKATSKEQSIRITSSSGLSREEIERMKKSAEEHAADDKSKRDEVETRNQADNLVFQSKKQLQEFGDKIPADKKKPLEDAIQKLEASAKTAPIAQLKSDIETLNKVWSEAATYMYQQQAQTAQQQPGAEQQGQQQQGQAEPKANTAENADYEIIDDKDKK